MSIAAMSNNGNIPSKIKVPVSRLLPLLETSIQLGNKQNVETLAAMGLPLTIKLSSTYPLHLAVANNQLDIATVLLEKGASINQPDAQGLTPIQIAALQKNEQMIACLVGHQMGHTIKTAEQLLKNPETAAYLDDLTKRIDDTRNIRNTFDPLQFAVSEALMVSAEELLKTTPSTTVTQNGETLLHLAVLSSSKSMVEFMIDKVDLNTPNLLGETPLHYAAAMGNIEAVEILLRHGAKLDADTGPISPLTLIGAMAHHKDPLALTNTQLVLFASASLYWLSVMAQNGWAPEGTEVAASWLSMAVLAATYCAELTVLLQNFEQSREKLLATAGHLGLTMLPSFGLTMLSPFNLAFKAWHTTQVVKKAFEQLSAYGAYVGHRNGAILGNVVVNAVNTSYSMHSLVKTGASTYKYMQDKINNFGKSAEKLDVKLLAAPKTQPPLPKQQLLETNKTTDLVNLISEKPAVVEYAPTVDQSTVVDTKLPQRQYVWLKNSPQAAVNTSLEFCSADFHPKPISNSAALTISAKETSTPAPTSPLPTPPANVHLKASPSPILPAPSLAPSAITPSVQPTVSQSPKPAPTNSPTTIHSFWTTITNFFGSFFTPSTDHSKIDPIDEIVEEYTFITPTIQKTTSVIEDVSADTSYFNQTLKVTTDDAMCMMGSKLESPFTQEVKPLRSEQPTVPQSPTPAHINTFSIIQEVWTTISNFFGTFFTTSEVHPKFEPISEIAKEYTFITPAASPVKAISLEKTPTVPYFNQTLNVEEVLSVVHPNTPATFTQEFKPLETILQTTVDPVFIETPANVTAATPTQNVENALAIIYPSIESKYAPVTKPLTVYQPKIDPMLLLAKKPMLSDYWFDSSFAPAISAEKIEVPAAITLEETSSPAVPYFNQTLKIEDALAVVPPSHDEPTFTQEFKPLQTVYNSKAEPVLVKKTMLADYLFNPKYAASTNVATVAPTDAAPAVPAAIMLEGTSSPAVPYFNQTLKIEDAFAVAPPSHDEPTFTQEETSTPALVQSAAVESNYPNMTLTATKPKLKNYGSILLSDLFKEPLKVIPQNIAKPKASSSHPNPFAAVCLTNDVKNKVRAKQGLDVTQATLATALVSLKEQQKVMQALAPSVLSHPVCTIDSKPWTNQTLVNQENEDVFALRPMFV